MNKLDLYLSERMRAAGAPASHDEALAAEARRYRRATTSQAKLSLAELAKAGFALEPHVPVPAELRRKPGRKRTREIVPPEVRAERSRLRYRETAFRARLEGAWRVALVAALLGAGGPLRRFQLTAWLGPEDRRRYELNTTRELRYVVRRGYVAKLGRGRYDVTERGREYVAMMG